MKEKKKKKFKEKKSSLPIPHYVCTGGCLTVSATPGKCRVSTCPRLRNPLTICHCDDGKHGDLLYKNSTRISR